MTKRTVFLLTAVTTGAIYGTISYSTYAKFTQIFNSINSPQCHDRVQFKAELNSFLSRPNPVGIIFVCGRLNAGKTTTIKSALDGRKYIASINWRDKTISNEEDLNNSLKEAFNITSFKDYWKKVDVGMLLTFLGFFLPKLNYSDSKTDLENTMKEIEIILKYAKEKHSGNIQYRPVIFIDEIGVLLNLLQKNHQEIAKKFVLWLVKISKDEMLCDIIFASHDGFTLKLLNLADPIYLTSVVIPSLTLEDMQSIGKCATKHEKEMFSIVGGHAGHVMKFINLENVLLMKLRLNEMKLAERIIWEESLFHARASGYCSPKIFGKRDYSSGCYERDELLRVFQLFIQHPEKDPEISLETVLREAKCELSVIQQFVYKHYLFYNPLHNTLSMRNKLFLDVLRESFNQQKEIDYKKWELTFFQEIEDNPDYAFDQRENAKKKKLEIMEELRNLEGKLLNEQKKYQDEIKQMEEVLEKNYQQSQSGDRSPETPQQQQPQKKQSMTEKLKENLPATPGQLVDKVLSFPLTVIDTIIKNFPRK